ncbi:apyrase [Orussus abietinus]|uniref:apyrase n=1 Tax=Orussus abietinus TaxID=222816 RepID=UPI000C715B4A|nr:apyrase [Orussus abietinus]
MTEVASWLVLSLVLTCHGFVTRDVTKQQQANLFELSVIHLNDFHARFMQTGPSSGTCYEEVKDKCLGGIARVYTASHRLMKERRNAIFLNAGDQFQGTLWYTLHRWNVTATFLNMLPHDALTLGNHEFDDKIPGVVPFLKMIDAPVVVANIDATDEPDMKGLYKNSTVLERGGRKIGVIGAIISSTDTLSSSGKLKFLDEVESINEEAKKLKDRGVDIIVVLDHCGLEIDRIIAKKCPDVDLIVGGHSHTFLYSGTPPLNDVPEDEYPVVVQQETTNRTVLIVQASAFTRYLGNLTVWFDEDGEVDSWEGNPILLDASIEEDPEVLQALEPWRIDVDALANRKIGAIKVPLSNNCRQAECNAGNFITDAMVDAFVDKAENVSSWTYAAISCMHVGGLRNSIEKTSGFITFGDLAAMLPFGDVWNAVELLGSDLLQVIEEGVTDSFSETEFVGKKLLVWSGIKVTYNLSMPAYSRVTEVKVR